MGGFHKVVSVCPMNFFRTTDTTDTTIWKPGFTNTRTAHTLFNVGTYAKLGFNDCASQFAKMPQDITFKIKQYSL